jgi:UDP-2,3-diacylglucosamine pyrophosphatase LpxH
VSRSWFHHNARSLSLRTHFSRAFRYAEGMRGARQKKPDDGFNYLLLSDVHLGSDIIPHLRPWALTSWLKQDAEIDARLSAWLDHYRTTRDRGRPWRLVIAGDFLDLVGVSIPTPASLRTKPTSEEQRHGAGSAVDHVIFKIEAIARRHVSVFRALGRFVAAGNALVIVRGNHDIELHWRAAQRALVDVILAQQPARERARLRAQIEIRPWFFAVDGLLYVEHGHEFDAMCSYGDPLGPTCQRDRRRIRWTPFSVLLRYVARPTRGLSSAGYGYVGMSAYAGLLVKLGVRGSFDIAGRYLRASYRLLGECLLNARTAASRRVRVWLARGPSRVDRARKSLARFALKSGVSEERLAHLCSLYVPPAVQRFGLMARSLYLDRIVCGLSSALSLLLSPLLWLQAGFASGLVSTGVGALFLLYALIGSGTNQSPQATMQRSAARIAALFSARWVVMGHTHEPVVTPVSDSASYVNLGSWGEDDPPDERPHSHQSQGTFLLVRMGAEDDFHAELMRWDAERGPLPA